MRGVARVLRCRRSTVQPHRESTLHLLRTTASALVVRTQQGAGNAVTGQDSPVLYSRRLEQAVLPQVASVVAAGRSMIGNR